MKSHYGKIALVVGASSGVGHAIASYLVQSGYTVYGSSRKTVSEPITDGIHWLSLDVTKEETIQEAVKVILEKSGEIGIVVNCPGIGLAGAIEDMEIAEAKTLFDTNFFGLMAVNKAILPHMRENGRGLLIQISSVAGLLSVPYQSMYCASKYALEAYTECLRMEIKPFGLQASLIEPGDMHTHFQRTYVKAYQDSIYFAKCDKAIQEMKRSEEKGPTADVVLKAFKHILKRKKPPIRVIVGVEYKIIGMLKRLLPNRVVEWIVSKIY